MKISYLLLGWGNKGGSIVLYNFMDNLVRRGHEVHAVFPDKNIKWEVGIWRYKLGTESENNNFLNFFKKNLFNIIPNSILEYYKSIIDKRNLNGLIDNWQTSDITVATFYLTAYAAYYLSDRTVPLYHMQHFEELFVSDKKNRLIARNTYYLPLIKIANSSWLKKIMKEKFNKEAYLVKPGIDLKIFKPYENPQNKYVYKNEWRILSYLDEKREWKGFNDAVKAVKIAREYLQEKGIKLRWEVFGIDPPSKKYETDFKYIGAIFNKDLAYLYSKTDIVLLTSWYESFPLPPIEAMACGSLIITTSFGTEDYVIDYQNGLVTMPRKILDIANKIIYAIENPNESLKMVKNGLKTAEEYDWESCTDVLEKVLTQSIENYSFDQFKFFDLLSEGKLNQLET
ncbi:MAG: glycosyltransferase family 4 protein [Methanobacteriaceae archaeon]|nr:glycosyltransferase family 4 protein [Methanobacteriaceae archaeon]